MQLKLALALALCVGICLAQEFPTSAECDAVDDDIYDIIIDGMGNTDIELEDYRGKVLMIFNSAVYSDTKYTDQYLVYNTLIEDFGNDTFDAIAIPTNQFGMEEPGLDREILNEIRYVRPGNNFVPNYVVASRTNANGPNADEIFDYLKDACPSPLREKIADTHKIYWSPTNQNDITWNFEKFLIGSDGKPFKRYVPDLSPDSEEIRGDIAALIAEKAKPKGEKVARQMHMRKP